MLWSISLSSLLVWRNTRKSRHLLARKRSFLTSRHLDDPFHHLILQCHRLNWSGSRVCFGPDSEAQCDGRHQTRWWGGIVDLHNQLSPGKNVCSGDQSRQKYARTQSEMFLLMGFCRRRSAFPLERMQIIWKSDSSGALKASGYRCTYVFENDKAFKAQRAQTHGFMGLKS